MNDEKKTKAQLIKELKSLRKQLNANNVSLPVAKTLMQNIKDSKDYLETIIKTSHDGILVLDSEGRFEFGNKSFYRIMGWPKKELIGESFIKVIPDELKEFMQERWQEAQAGKGKPYETAILTKKGQRRQLYVSHKDMTIAGERKYCVAIRDITESKKNEHALRESEEKYRDLIVNIPYATWSSDIDRSNYYISENIEAIYGYTQKEVYRDGLEGWYSRIHPDDLNVVSGALGELFTDKKPMSIEYRVRKKDGKYVWMNNKAEVSTSSDGHQYVYGIFSNITERKETQLALHKSEERYRVLVANLPSAVWRSDSDGSNYYVSPNIKDFYGYTDKDIYEGRTAFWHSRIHPDDLERVKAAYESLWLNNAPFYIEYKLRHKDGHWMCVSDKVSIRRNDDGSQSVYGIFSDVTERKEAQIALAQSESQYRSLVQKFHGIVFKCDHNWNLTFMHGAVKSITGYSARDFCSCKVNWGQIIHPDDLERVFKQGEKLLADPNYSAERHYRIINKNGKVRWIDENSDPTVDEFGNIIGVQGTIRDVTEHMSAVNELRRSQQNLKVLMDNTPAVVYRCLNDSNWSVDFVSKQIKQLTGYSAKDFLSGKVKWEDMVLPEDLHKLENAQVSSKKRTKYNREYRIITSRGKIKWVMVKGANIYDESGKLDHTEGFIVDITESKNIQLALQDKEEMIRQLTENIDEVFWICEPDWSKVHYMSKAYKTIFGQSLKMVYKNPRSWRKLVLEEDQEAVFSAFPERFPEDVAVLNMPEYRIKHSNGSIRWIRSRVFPIHDQLGRVYRVAGIAEDVTEQKTIEEQLHEGEKKYSQLIETMPDGVGAVDQDGVMTFVNKAFTDILGYSEKDIKGEHVRVLFDDKGFERYTKQRIERRKGVSEVYYADLRHIDGHMVPVVVRPASIFDENGEFKGSFGIFTDLTDQKEIQSELKQTETQYKTLFESSQDAIMILNDEMQFVEGNPATLKLFGCKSEKEFLGKTPMDFSPEIQPEGIASLEKAVTVTEKTFKEGSCIFEWQHKLSNGREFLCTILLTVMELKGKRVMLATTRDITDQKKAQDAVKNLLDFENLINEISTSFINLPVERTDMGINIALGILSRFLRIDRSSVVLFSEGLSITDVVYEWCGKGIASRREEAVNFPTKDFKWWLARLKKGQPIYMHSLDEFPKSAAKEKELFASTDIKSYVTVPISFNKELIGFMNFYSIKKSKVWDAETISLLTIVAEIFVNTIMRSRTQRELREYDAKMFRTEQLASLGIISANIAHELNQPLTVIQLLLQQVNRSLPKKTKGFSEVKENIEDSLAELSRAAEIVARFRTFARQSSPSNIERINICEVAENLVKALSSGARKSLLKLSLKKSKSDIYVRATAADIEQIFFVLIQNSIQAANPKEKNQLNIKISCKKDEVLVDFQDDCGGIDEELMGKIFEPFFTTKPRQKGTGLGLPILERIVTRYEGHVKCKNSPGQGICFHISLPLSR